MRDLITVSFTIIQLGCYSQLQQTTNPFGQYQEEEKHRISQVDSLEIIADSENARIQQAIMYRRRLNEVQIDGIYTSVDLTFSMELEVNDEGIVVDVLWVEGNVEDPKLKQLVATAAKTQLRYDKVDLGFNTTHSYTIKIIAH